MSKLRYRDEEHATQERKLCTPEKERKKERREEEKRKDEQRGRQLDRN